VTDSSARALERASFAMALLFAFALPWERSIPVPGVGSVGRVIGLVAFAFAIMALFDTGRLRIRRPPLMIVFAAAFTLWSTASVFWSIEKAETLARAFTYAQLLAMVWVFWQAASTSRRRRALLQAYVLGGYVMILAVLVAFLAAQGAEGLVRYTGFDENENYLAQRLALGLPLAWYLTLRGDAPLLRWVNPVYLPACLLAISLSASRGAFVMALAALTAVPLTVGHLSAKRAIVLVVTLVLGIGAVAIVVPEDNVSRLAETGERILEGDLTLREVIWRAGLQAYLDPSVSWLVGSGSATFPALVAPMFGSTRTSHNGYLSVLIELGVVGAVLFLAIIGVTLAPLATLPSLERGMCVGLALALAVVMMSSSWDFERAWWFGMAVIAIHAAFVVDPQGREAGERLARRVG